MMTDEEIRSIREKWRAERKDPDADRADAFLRRLDPNAKDGPWILGPAAPFELRDLIKAVREEERAACARICEEWPGDRPNAPERMRGTSFANLIRAPRDEDRSTHAKENEK